MFTTHPSPSTFMYVWDKSRGVVCVWMKSSAIRETDLMSRGTDDVSQVEDYDRGDPS